MTDFNLSDQEDEPVRKPGATWRMTHEEQQLVNAKRAKALEGLSMGTVIKHQGDYVAPLPVNKETGQIQPQVTAPWLPLQQEFNQTLDKHLRGANKVIRGR